MGTFGSEDKCLSFVYAAPLCRLPVHIVEMLLQYDTLSGLVLPSKRAFDNMNKEFLEKRKIGLNTYLQVHCQEEVLSAPLLMLSFFAVHVWLLKISL